MFINDFLNPFFLTVPYRIAILLKTMDSIRTFIALELPQSIHEELSTIISSLKKKVPAGIRWVPANNIHITLKFLGDVSKNNLAAIDQAVGSITKGYSAFDIHLGGLGRLPQPAPPACRLDRHPGSGYPGKNGAGNRPSACQAGLPS